MSELLSKSEYENLLDKLHTVDSSFIKAIGYVKADFGKPDQGFILIQMMEDSSVYAYFTRNWVYAKLCQQEKTGGSIGLIYNKYIRGSRNSFRVIHHD